MTRAGEVLIDGTTTQQRYRTIQDLPRGTFFTVPALGGDRMLAFEQVKDELPRPWVETRPDLSDCYDTCVRLLFEHRHQPAAASGLPSPYLDAAFNQNIFMWDTAFITMFARLLHPWVPAICSQDNFYARQYPDGEICREISSRSGEDLAWWVNLGGGPLYSFFHQDYGFRALGCRAPDIDIDHTWHPDLGRTPVHPPLLTLDAMNNPVMAWAEVLSYQQTGDLERLQQVLPPLMAYFTALDEHLRHSSGFYVTDWASMDNSPRNEYLGFGVDTACQMVLFADNLLEIADILREAGRPAPIDEDLLRSRKATVTDLVNQRMWDEDRGYYFDLDRSLNRCPVRTIGAMWALISGVAPTERAECLAQALEDPTAFNRPHRVPTVPADEPSYVSEGGYWRGGVWAPTNQMVVAGLDRAGHHQLARDIATNHANALAHIHAAEKTVFEYYSPEHLDAGNNDHRDFVGWSGMGPIGFFLTHVIGIQADARTQTLTWRLPTEPTACGVTNYWFAGRQMSLQAQPVDGGWALQVDGAQGLALRIVTATTQTTLTGLGGQEHVVVGS